METTNLRCEYFKNPLGLDVPLPRLSWQLQSTEQGAKQTAYQIVINSGSDVIWDTGKVKSSQSVHIVYNGPALASGQRVTWKVRTWDQNGIPSLYSAPAWWEMGLLNRKDWMGQWIGSSVAGGPYTMAPCPFLRKPFILDRPLAAARLYITALGLYEAFINGNLVTEDIFTPGWPEFRNRTIYQVYDVTELLQTGKNAMGIVLGDGWYCGHVGWDPRQFFGDRPKLLAQLKLDYADRSEYFIVTDSTWKTVTGPLLESDIMMGESYDARRDIPGWNLPDFDDSSWCCVATFPDPGIAIVAQQGPRVRRIQELKPIAEPTRTIYSGYIYDLGQNITGRVRLKVSGPKGTTIRLRFSEMLKSDGTIYSENLRLARATDYYTLKGDSEEVYEPRFTFHGFRYVEVGGLPGDPGPDMVTGIVIHSATPPTGTFECSDPLINQLQHNIQWSQKDNFLEIPTDCPQRDERLGWTGDAQVFIRTAAFNMNIAGFFTKWLDDMVASQSREGWIPKTIPNTELNNKDAGPAWADALIICPWTLYLCYGDTHLLEKHYAALKRFVDYLSRTSQREIRCHPTVDPWGGFGDWLALDGSGKTEGGTSKDLIGTAFFAYSARLMANIAQVLGKDNDAEYYMKMSERVHEAFNRRFVTQEGLIVSQTQTAYVLALHFDLLPEELRPAAVDTLVNDIEQRGWHLSTGFVGSPYLLHVLTRFGRLDVAYKLLFQKTWPSWLYAVTQGATTIWERWDGWTHDRGFQDPGMNSFNHYAYGAIGDWLYAVVAGINVDPARPGYKHIIFHAQPGGSLKSAKATLNSIYGLIVSDWRIVDDQFAWDIIVPPNTTATILLPGAIASQEVEAGKHHFTKDWHESVNGR